MYKTKYNYTNSVIDEEISTKFCYSTLCPLKLLRYQIFGEKEARRIYKLLKNKIKWEWRKYYNPRFKRYERTPRG